MMLFSEIFNEEKIHAEMENITKVKTELEKVKDRPKKETVVLVGIGGYLQNIYKGKGGSSL